MKKTLLLISLLYCLHLPTFAQLSETEQLKLSLNNIKDSLKYVDALNRLGTLMYEKNLDSSFSLTKKAREIADRHDYEQGKADAFTNLGAVFYYKGELQVGMRYYNEALTVYKKIKDSANIVQSMMNIGNVYKDLRKNTRSQEWFDKAIQTGQHLRKDSIMSLVIWNSMFSYPERFSENEWTKNISKIKEIALKHKDKRMLFLVEKFIADDLIKKGKRKEGLQLLKSTAEQASNLGYLFSAIHIYTDLGNILRDDNPQLAAKMYKKGLATAEKNVILDLSIDISKALFDLYARQGDNKQAIVYAYKSIQLRDEQYRLGNSSDIDYMDYALQEEQVKSLTVRSGYQVTLLMAIAIACLLALAILIVVRQNLKRIKKFNLQISTQNNELKTALRALEQSQSENTRMLKIVAHDLRSPIASIYSLSSMMMNEQSFSESNLDLLKLIKDSSNDSLKLVNDVLQMQFKTETLDKAPVDLAELLQRCVSLLSNSANSKAQIINLHVQHITLLANGEKLWRVMSNLITNAIKFSPNKAVINVGMEKSANYVRIGVDDEGIGIPVGIEDKIFEMFTEAKRPGTAGEPPFGLGLGISKQIVEAHNGKIWFERKVDRGTIFFVEFPLCCN